MNTNIDPEDIFADVHALAEQDTEGLYLDGMTPRAAHFMEQAEARRAIVADAAGEAPGHPDDVKEIAGMLAKAFISVARNGFRPNQTKPFLLAISAIKTLFLDFATTPDSIAYENRPLRKPWDSNVDAYGILEQWVIYRSLCPNIADIATHELSMLAYADIVDLGTQTFMDVAYAGAEIIVHDEHSSEVKDKAAVEALLTAVAKACRFNVFDLSELTGLSEYEIMELIEGMSITVEQANAIAAAMLDAHTRFIDKSSIVKKILEKPSKTIEPTQSQAMEQKTSAPKKPKKAVPPIVSKGKR